MAGRRARRPGPRRGGPDALLDVVEQLQGAAMPASILERDVLPARLPGYRREDLDTLCAAGEVVWVGLEPLGERDGRIALFLTDDLPLLLPTRPEPPRGALHEAIRDHLAQPRRVASSATCSKRPAGAWPAQVVDALWDLAWAGEVTNDTPGALRAFLAARVARAERRGRLSAFRSRRQVPASAVGRWSRLPLPRRAPTATERARALAGQLLARHGILTRDAVATEGVAGGFSAVYPVLRALEEQGRVRRGYFVAGLGGLQFAEPGALERLRARREPDPESALAVVLAAADPANPYGAALPWPRADTVRPQRAAGAARRPRRRRARGVSSRAAAARSAWRCPLTSRVARARRARPRARCAAGASGPAAPRSAGARTPPPLAAGPLAPFLVEAGFVRSGPGFRLDLRGAPRAAPPVEEGDESVE